VAVPHLSMGMRLHYCLDSHPLGPSEVERSASDARPSCHDSLRLLSNLRARPRVGERCFCARNGRKLQYRLCHHTWSHNHRFAHRCFANEPCSWYILLLGYQWKHTMAQQRRSSQSFQHSDDPNTCGHAHHLFATRIRAASSNCITSAIDSAVHHSRLESSSTVCGTLDISDNDRSIWLNSNHQHHHERAQR
jgi:hypothetical protein